MGTRVRIVLERCRDALCEGCSTIRARYRFPPLSAALISCSSATSTIVCEHSRWNCQMGDER